MTKSLLSVGQIAKKGFLVLFDDKQCVIMRKSDRSVVTTGSLDPSNNLYRLHLSPVLRYDVNLTHATTSDLSQLQLWHRRLAHLNYRGLKFMSDHQMTTGLPAMHECDEVCTGCQLGKQTRERFPRSQTRTSRVLEMVHSDLCGPLPVRSLAGSFYFMTIVDDYSRKVFVYFLHRKSEAFSKFLEFKQEAEKQTGQSIQIIRSDRGGEYMSREFIQYCKDSGIVRQYTQAHTHHNRMGCLRG